MWSVAGDDGGMLRKGRGCVASSGAAERHPSIGINGQFAWLGGLFSCRKQAWSQGEMAPSCQLLVAQQTRLIKAKPCCRLVGVMER